MPTHRHSLSLGLLTWAAMLFAIVIPLRAQSEIVIEGVPVLADTKGNHVVRPGETLEDIAEYYLGTATRWREIWVLNPELPNPDLIYPGDTITVPVPARLPEDSAWLLGVSRRVEDQRAPRSWEAAETNHLLKTRDGLKTFEGASAEILFADDTALLLTEESLVYLGDEGAAPATSTAAPVRRREVVIDYGQADLESRPAANAEPGTGPSTPPEIVIVMGDAVATPQPSPEGKIQARSRRPDGRGAQLMVYLGRSDLTAGGSRVEVSEGMGTTAAEGEAPSPPEKLLEAPEQIAPPAGSSWEIPNPGFEWSAVAKADKYTLEVCRDERCASLEERVTDLQATDWRPARLPNGDYFWRVTAQSASGLDGYPSPPRAVTIAGQDFDTTPPSVRVLFFGPQVGVGTLRVLGIGGRIEHEVADDGIGLDRFTLFLDDAEATAESFAGPWTPGRHTVSIRAIDKAGNARRLEPIPFAYDPDPPTISWGLEAGDGDRNGNGNGNGDGHGEELGSVTGITTEIDVYKKRQPSVFGTFWAQITGKDQSPLAWTSSGRHFLPMTYDDWRIGSDKPFIVIRARQEKKPVDLPRLGQTLRRDEPGLWIRATDPGCGVERFTYQLLIDSDGRRVLVLEAADALGNVTRVAWPIELAGS